MKDVYQAIDCWVITCETIAFSIENLDHEKANVSDMLREAGEDVRALQKLMLDKQKELD